MWPVLWDWTEFRRENDAKVTTRTTRPLARPVPTRRVNRQDANRAPPVDTDFPNLNFEIACRGSAPLGGVGDDDSAASSSGSALSRRELNDLLHRFQKQLLDAKRVGDHTKVEQLKLQVLRLEKQQKVLSTACVTTVMSSKAPFAEEQQTQRERMAKQSDERGSKAQCFLARLEQARAELSQQQHAVAPKPERRWEPGLLPSDEDDLDISTPRSLAFRSRWRHDNIESRAPVLRLEPQGRTQDPESGLLPSRDVDATLQSMSEWHIAQDQAHRERKQLLWRGRGAGRGA